MMRLVLQRNKIIAQNVAVPKNAEKTPAMSKKGSTLAERLALLEHRCGSQRAVARLLGISDMTIKRWKLGAIPLPSKIRRASQHSGLSEKWLGKGEGDAEAELEKCREVSVQDAATEKLQEEAPGTMQAIAFIERHGTPAEKKMVERILTGALETIRERQRAEQSALPATRYPRPGE